MSVRDLSQNDGENILGTQEVFLAVEQNYSNIQALSLDTAVIFLKDGENSLASREIFSVSGQNNFTSRALSLNVAVIFLKAQEK